MAENWNSEEFISDRLEFATTGGKLFKEELQDKWENSTYKTYINDLRNNLASHTSFSLQNTDNLTLKSFAAYCQKGEEDIDKLLSTSLTTKNHVALAGNSICVPVMEAIFTEFLGEYISQTKLTKSFTQLSLF